ncbi:MAG: DNA repair protein RadC [Saprospiraceae bacterium]
MDKGKSSIKNWSEQDKPREKLMAGGPASLSDSELIAILLVTGVKNQSAIDVARSLLQKTNHSINDLANLSIKELKQIKGIGEAKAITIIAALELGRRRSVEPKQSKQKIDSAKKAASLFDELKLSKQEEFWIACLNRQLKLVHISRVHLGGISQVVADPRILFRIALEHHATSVIVAHNHPSGVTRPSKEDEIMTNRLKAAAALLDITLADHIIVAEEGYFSFADEGML